MTIKHPTTCLIAGGTGSGKTVLTRRLLENHAKCMANLPANPRVLWCYGIFQPLYRIPIANVSMTYHEGLISESELKHDTPDIVVIDDLMQEKSSDQGLANMFTRSSHHMNITVVFLTQNLFNKGLRTVSLNSHYMILMKNPRDKSQIASIGRQLFPGKTKFFTEAYEDATAPNFGYLLLDLSPSCEDNIRVRTHIFPDAGGHVRETVYQPK